MGFKKNTYFLLVIFIVLLFFGCDRALKENENHSQITAEEVTPNQTQIRKNSANLDQPSIIPLKMKQEQFQEMVGWLTNEEVLFIEYINNEYKISSYHFFTGEKKEIYSNTIPIIQASLSPSGQYLLIHSSAKVYEAHIQIIRLEDNQLIFDERVQSSEISFVWNSYDEAKLFFVAFFEDWSFDTYIINTNEQQMLETNLPYPFAIWADEHTLVTLNWEHNSLDATAPIVAYRNGKTKSVLDDKQFYFLHGRARTFLGISLNENDESLSNINIYDENFDPVNTFQIPHLTQFSGWMIPYFDISSKNELYMILPKKSGEADLYRSGFELVKIDPITNEKVILLNSVDNEPLLLSPNGEFALIGNLFDEILSINHKKIKPIFLFE